MPEKLYTTFKSAQSLNYTCPSVNASGLFHTAALCSCYSGAQKNLRHSGKTLPTNNYLIGFGFMPSSLHSPLTIWWPQMDSFPPFLLRPQLCLGGRKEIASFTDITWKVPTLLTFTVALIAGFSFRCGKPYFCLRNYHVEFQKSCGVGKNKKKQRRGGEEVEKHKTTKYLVQISLLHRESNTK